MSHRNIDRKDINRSKLPKGSRTVYPGSSAAYGGTLMADRGFHSPLRRICLLIEFNTFTTQR